MNLDRELAPIGGASAKLLTARCLPYQLPGVLKLFEVVMRHRRPLFANPDYGTARLDVNVATAPLLVAKGGVA